MRHPIKFSTGREIDPNGSIVGLSESLRVYEGYDGPIDIMDGDDQWKYEPLTQVEALELACIMIDRWAALRDMLQNELKEINKQ